MEHLERTLIEILRRLNELERKTKTQNKSNKNIISSSGGKTTVYANDHRFLENLNSEQYTHLTRDEYNKLRNTSNNHGALEGLANDDHKQYIRHNLAVQDWDILAGSSGKVFLRKSIDELRNKIAEKIFPESDSTDSITFYKSNGNTPVVIIDTLNRRLGIGVRPQSTLHVGGDAEIGNDILLAATAPASITAIKELAVKSDADITLDATNVLLASHMQSDTFAEDGYGWRLSRNGNAEFRNIKVNKITGRIAVTGTEQFMGGRQTLCKSASPLSSPFYVPEAGAAAELSVERFADYPDAVVFDDGDIVRLAHISLFNGEYNVSDCWGSVTLSPFEVNGEHTYIFTRSSAPNSGSVNAGVVINTGELVLNYGTTGMGYIIATAV